MIGTLRRRVFIITCLALVFLAGCEEKSAGENPFTASEESAEEVISTTSQQEEIDLDAIYEKRYEDLTYTSLEPAENVTGQTDAAFWKKLFGENFTYTPVDFERLQEENPDVYAYITIPDTVVDYPVYQHPEDDYYYLEHNADGSAGYPGCVYSERINAKDFSDFHTVLYAHNMKNGTMFGALHRYESESFFTDHPYFLVETPERGYVYEVFSVHSFDDRHLLACYDFSRPEVRERYIQMITELEGNGLVERDGNHVRELPVTSHSRILTLATCVGSRPNLRFHVHAIPVYYYDRDAE